MSTILALIDFTETSKKAVEQAVAIALKNDVSLKLCHIMGPKEEEAVVKADMYDYMKNVEARGLQVDMLMQRGDFMPEVQELVKRIRPSLVVVGTHGSTGWKQHLLGSNIFKLVKSLSSPTLVINDDFNIIDGGFTKILIPVAPHSDFLKKVEESANLLASNGKIEIFAIVKPGVELDEKIQNNIDSSGDYLKANGINWEYKEVESSSFSVGYSRETIKYAQANGVDLISIMAQVSEENKSFGTMDKENMLLNESGIAILCA